MIYSFKLFKLFGTTIYLDATWFILLLLIMFPLLTSSDIPGDNLFLVIGLTLLVVCFFYTCIIIHEFAHIFTGRRFGVDTKRITIFIFGGAAHMETIPFGFPEFCIALAGPVCSALLGSILCLVAILLPVGDIAEGIWLLGSLNFILAGFNVVPMFPLDGGRILRGLLYCWLKKPVLSTKIAVYIGLPIIPITFYLFIPFSIFSTVLAILIAVAAYAELHNVRRQYHDK